MQPRLVITERVQLGAQQRTYVLPYNRVIVANKNTERRAHERLGELMKLAGGLPPDPYMGFSMDPEIACYNHPVFTAHGEG